MKRYLFSAIVFMFFIGKMYGQTTLMLTTTVTPATACTTPCNGTATVNVTNGTPPYTYLWNVNPPQQTQTASGLCPGQYQVGVWDASTPFPGQGTTLVTITCAATGVNTVSVDENISVFPNPAHNEIYLQLNSSIQGKADFIVRNILGTVVYQEAIETNGTLYKLIDISTLPTGIYDVEFMNGTKIIRNKFIKQ